MQVSRAGGKGGAIVSAIISCRVSSDSCVCAISIRHSGSELWQVILVLQCWQCCPWRSGVALAEIVSPNCNSRCCYESDVAEGMRLPFYATQPGASMAMEIKPCSPGTTLAILYFPLGLWALHDILLTKHNGDRPTGLYTGQAVASLISCLCSLALSVSGLIVALPHAALLYWLNFNSQPSPAHVRCLLYTLRVPVPFILVHVTGMTPIAIMFALMITSPSLTMRLLYRYEWAQ